jgi:hypothetical protein
LLSSRCPAWAQTETKKRPGASAEWWVRSAAHHGRRRGLGASIAFSANYARQLKRGSTSLFVEFTFVAEPSNSVQSSDGQSIVSLATIFVVPSLRVEFAPNAVISPWVSGGFGYGYLRG